MPRGWGITILTAAALWMSTTAADAQPPEPAYLLVDAESGTVLEAENATHPWYPASLTKVMTAYMVFLAIEKGWLTLDEKVTVSAKAATQPPTKLGLRTGQEVRVALLLEAMIVRSANDAAVTLAEAVSGSEEHFAISMTRQARKLGMSQSFFRNASGLPHAGQVTTARDLAILARALIRDYPAHFHLFSKSHVSISGLGGGSTNGWMRAYPGAEGIKTGFTCGSGYNLLAAATRNGRRLIAIVLGGRTGGERNAMATQLMDSGFAMSAEQASGAFRLSALRGQARSDVPYVLADGRCPVAPSPGSEVLAQGTLPGWGLVFGSFTDREVARATIEGNQAALKEVISQGRPAIIAKRRDVPPSYSALLVGLQEADAGQACRHLQELGVYCLAIPPKLLNNPHTLWR
ncbi:D-alanyl-D-alanine carboxypeptidase family protein [Pelagibius marinus]|uniref:D-alanyl-D-alanine carboxypeptidase family protein n=1 Tax=Pelagibius marinus TaxID=2762760 RepID=UPI00187239C9|nr:D-alanyl-D-alanine carboxypeptidase family protein [Pelagibius marinus]